MSNQQQIDALAEIFRLLGADDPDSWATSEVDEGIPQLAMYVFLKRALQIFGEEASQRWLQSVMHGHSDQHQATKRVLSCIIDQKVPREDIQSVLEAFGRDLLMEMCCLLDNVSASHFAHHELNRRLANVNWCLYVVDDKGKPGAAMQGLHEIVNDVAAATNRKTD